MSKHSLNCGAAAALYLHIPFCLSKCDYCAFNSYPLKGRDPVRYVEAIKRQIILLASHPLITGARFDTVYIGGGTPTCLEGPLLLDLLDCLQTSFRLENGLETTIEANPGSISTEKLAALISAGVNRLSLGVQSFSDRLLQTIGRRHSEKDIYRVVETIRKAGCANLSLDLIFGLPGQSLRDWEESLEAAFALGPQHLSLYELMVEEDTPLAQRLSKDELHLPDEDLVADMAEMARSHCREQGLHQYEIANFAGEGCRCRHNLHYWHNHDYLGLGAGAVSGWQGLRISSEPDPERFTSELEAGRLPITGAEGLCREAGFRETVIMGLRMIEGISLAEMERRFGISLTAYYGRELTNLLHAGLLAQEEDRLRLTGKGLPVANQVLSRLV